MNRTLFFSSALFPEPVPFKPPEQNLTPRNPSNTETFETSGSQPSEPGTMPRVGTLFPGTGSENWARNRFPEPPQLAQNTPKSILGKDPIAFCCWGKNTEPWLVILPKTNIVPEKCWLGNYFPFWETLFFWGAMSKIKRGQVSQNQ